MKKNPRPIACDLIGARRSAVVQIHQYFFAILDNRVVAFAGNIYNRTDTTGIVFASRLVQAAVSWRSNLHKLYSFQIKISCRIFRKSIIHNMLQAVLPYEIISGGHTHKSAPAAFFEHGKGRYIRDLFIISCWNYKRISYHSKGKIHAASNASNVSPGEIIQQYLH